jgi:hypothetical protein
VRRPTRRQTGFAAAAVLGLSGTAALVVGLSSPAPAAVPTSVAQTEPAVPTGRPVASAPASSAPPTTPEARYTPSSATHVVIPSVGLDLPMLPLAPAEGVIDPPLLTAAYWIEPYGAPVGSADQADNTLYLAAHSAGYGTDGFDPLLDADHEATTLATGDLVEVRTPEGTVTYAVTSAQRYAKEALPAAAEVWEQAPGRLVLITCFQRTGGRLATENLVVVAEAVS